jgi:hypothetical protein
MPGTRASPEIIQRQSIVCLANERHTIGESQETRLRLYLLELTFRFGHTTAYFFHQ